MTTHSITTIDAGKRAALLLGTGLLALSLLPGCATRVKASTSQNPPPKQAFSAYGRIELRPTTFAPGIKGADAAGLAKINDNLQKDLAVSLANWNKRPANGRTLVIEPVIEEMQFTHGAKRVLLGPLAGSSGVLMRLNIHEAGGTMVANPEFFQRAGAMAAGFVLGVHDNLMLTRVANLASSYIIANYARAEGGPSGADDQSIASK